MLIFCTLLREHQILKPLQPTLEIIASWLYVCFLAVGRNLPEHWPYFPQDNTRGVKHYGQPLLAKVSVAL